MLNGMPPPRVTNLCLHSNKDALVAPPKHCRRRDVFYGIRLRNVIACSAAIGGLPVHCLPNGLCLRHASSAAEVQFLYDEQYKQRVYLQHQVALHRGDIVLDVGANIGCFSMYAAETVGPEGCVLSIEPGPRIAAALATNLQQHAAWFAGGQVAKCQIVQAALGDGSQEKAQFTVYKGAAGWSTMERDDAETLRNMQAFVANMLQTGTGSSSTVTSSTISAGGNDGGWALPQQLLVSAGRWLHHTPFLRPLSSFMAEAYVKLVMLRDAETISCQVVTVSQLMEQHNLRHVDLLKIDVERAELQVLSGVAQHTWPAIQQVAMEVHDVHGRLAAVLDLLRHTAGYTSVVVEQGPMMQGTNLYNVYAVRTAPPA